MIEEYLEAIGATPTVRSRVEVIRNYYASLLPEVNLSRAFISEIRDSDGLRVWQNLWLWGSTGNYVAESYNFLYEDSFDGALFDNLVRWTIKMTDFDIIGTPNERSRVNLTFSFSSRDLSGTMNASGENCAYLIAFFNEVVRPRILGAEGDLPPRN